MWIKTKKYIKLQRGAIEILENRKRIGFLSCPECHELFGIYADEFHSDGKSRYPIKHSCGFNHMIELSDWFERQPTDYIPY
jgi:transposase-like protein